MILKIGVVGTADPTYSNTSDIHGNREGELKISQWFKPLSIKRDYTNLFQNLFEAFFKPTIRANPSGLITIQQTQDGRTFAQNRLDETISRQQKCAVLFLDLDKFKEINDRFGMTRGDELIQQFAALLERITKNRGIPLNNGGDEFVILYPSGSYENSLLLAFEISNAIESPEFKIEDVKVGVSIGIDININFDNPKLFPNLVTDSESILKEVKQQKRGLTRIFKNLNADYLELPLENALDLSLCITKCGALNSTPYQNVWLNALSKYISQEIQNRGFSNEIISNSVKDYIEWADLDFNERINVTVQIRPQILVQ